MRSNWSLTGIFLLALVTTSLAFARESKSGPLTGSWECVAHSSIQADVQFTLNLEQTDETVKGTFTNASGEYPLSSASYNKGVLQFHVNARDGKYVATAKLSHGELIGHWSKDQAIEGGWEGKRSTPEKQ